MSGRETPIVIVTGPPAAGKTTLATAIAEAAAVPLIAKDPFKELLFDSLGTGDVGWSRSLGRAVYPLLFHVLELQLQAGRSCVLEANFDHEAASTAMQRLAVESPFRALQVVCTAEPDVVLRRYMARAGTRHPGHLDELRLGDVRDALAAERWRALDGLRGETIKLDTTDFSTERTAMVVDRARRWLS